MRKITFVLVVCAFFARNINAQEYKSVICVNAGLSLVGDFFNVAGNGSISNLPAFQLTYDYHLAKWFSLGFAGSYQLMSIDYTSYQNNISRINFALRPLFHYGSFKRIDMYSGLRIGYTMWKATSNNPNPNYDPTSVISGSLGNFAPQLILYGLRVYFSDHIGANLELGIGAPHYFSAGLNYRL